MRTFAEDLDATKAVHGHVCPGIILGVRMAHLGLRNLCIDDPDNYRDLIVYVEMDRCAADAVSVATHCTPGRRQLKIVDYGKMAATFVDLAANKAVRVAAAGEFPGPENWDDQVPYWQAIADEELFRVESVTVEVKPEDRPGRPLRSETCQVWGEQIKDGREVAKEGSILCRACAYEPYYRRLSE